MTEEVKDVEEVKAPVKPVENPAVKTKRNRKNNKGEDGSITLSNGMRVMLRPVAANIISEVRNQIPDALMRTYVDKQTGKELENPAHPEYIADQAEVTKKREKATMDAFVLFGIDLLDPVPEERDWIDKLVFLKIISAEEAENLTPMTLELYYKKYVISDTSIMTKIVALSGVSEEMLALARDSFQREEDGVSD